MNLDRATLNFLNSFSEDAKNEGQRLHDDGGVVQIFGNHLSIQGKVEEGSWSCRTNLRLSGNEWTGKASTKGESGAAALYATMLERLARGSELPEEPNEVGEKSLTEVIEENLGRSLTGIEDEFVGKLEKRFRRFEIDREIFDHDIVRICPRWEVDKFEPLTDLWPEAPANIVEFWNYLAYAIRKRNHEYPEFMEAITDPEWTVKKMRQWEEDREASEWRYTVEAFENRAPDDGVDPVEFRLRVSGREARLLWRHGGEEPFQRLTDSEDFDRLRERYAAGGLRMDAASEILWSKFLRSSADQDVEDGSLSLEKIENCRLLNRILHQPEAAVAIVTLDEVPFRKASGPLTWICRDDSLGSDKYELQLVTSEGVDVPHMLRLLPGEENLYLSDETCFAGPDFWSADESLVEPRYVLPRDVIESEAGVTFLAHVGADLPEDLSRRVRDEPLHVTLELQLVRNTTSASSEHLLIKPIARNHDGSREEFLERDGWTVTEA